MTALRRTGTGAWLVGDGPILLRRPYKKRWRASALSTKGEQWLVEVELAGELFVTRRDAQRAVQAAMARHPAPAWTLPKLRRQPDGTYRCGEWQVSRAPRGGWEVFRSSWDGGLDHRSTAVSLPAARRTIMRVSRGAG